MKVYVAFEFDNVNDIWSDEANEIVASIIESCETMKIGLDASECYVDGLPDRHE